MSRLASLQDLYIHVLKDIYNAETQLTKALPKLEAKARNEQLQVAFRTHLQETQGQIKRLETIFQRHGQSPQGVACRGMQGVIAEAEETMAEDADPEVMDAALISCAQHAEHYEIAGYGTVCQWAEQLGLKEDKELLGQSLNEEEATDRKLSQLAESRVNASAMQGAGR